MGGLALGNALISRFGRDVTNPVGFYALMELLVGPGGRCWSCAFPCFRSGSGPCSSRPWTSPCCSTALRFSFSFLLFLLPATAMGVTLPLLVKALTRRPGEFGKALGRLYGVNTLGACLGALAGETLLYRAAGAGRHRPFRHRPQCRGRSGGAGHCRPVPRGAGPGTGRNQGRPSPPDPAGQTASGGRIPGRRGVFGPGSGLDAVFATFRALDESGVRRHVGRDPGRHRPWRHVRRLVAAPRGRRPPDHRPPGPAGRRGRPGLLRRL